MSEVDPGNADRVEEPEELWISRAGDGGVRVVTLAGEIDYHNRAAFAAALTVPPGPRPRVVLDMRRVSFMDSTGLNALITAHRALDAAGGRLRLVAPTDMIKRTMGIVGIDAFIECRDTLDEALKE
ncbi:STAS domain-containing protein [Streptomyces alkaliphilus]|uniref:STAS domain-containing protein n=1 Tax=Streptomyces alkaliphilus TaxID=1472722 RepID=UPI0011808401|nr:STAS domain-containing protein [Streptomyces alkaliphilus]MQS08562.1 anti-sigma factor antagonist [Streptomyces alkaliphilus]